MIDTEILAECRKKKESLKRAGEGIVLVKKGC